MSAKVAAGDGAAAAAGKTLLIIDPQNDFHPNGVEEGPGRGSLAVPGADEDAAKIAE